MSNKTVSTLIDDDIDAIFAPRPAAQATMFDTPGRLVCRVCGLFAVVAVAGVPICEGCGADIDASRARVHADTEAAAARYASVVNSESEADQQRLEKLEQTEGRNARAAYRGEPLPIPADKLLRSVVKASQADDGLGVLLRARAVFREAANKASQALDALDEVGL